MSDFFEIGVINPKTPQNIGTLWRSAYQLGASGIFTVGERYGKQGSDTVKAWSSIPLRRYQDIQQLIDTLPYSTMLIAVEMGGFKLEDFKHPKRAVYLLGAEDHGLPKSVIQQCHYCISLSSERTQSYNVAVAGSIVMYHRVYVSSLFNH
jgi:tRNA G18 (ribose-2'-O)-methylase SpoU